MKQDPSVEDGHSFVEDTTSRSPLQFAQRALIVAAVLGLAVFVLASFVLWPPRPAPPSRPTLAPTPIIITVIATREPLPTLPPSPTPQPPVAVERVPLVRLPREWFRNDAMLQPQVSPNGQWMYRVSNPAQNKYEVWVTRIVSDTGADAVLDAGMEPFRFTARSVSDSISWSPDSGAFAVVAVDRVTTRFISGRAFVFEPTPATDVLSPTGVLTVERITAAYAWTPNGGAFAVGDGEDVLAFIRASNNVIRVRTALTTPAVKWQQPDRLSALSFGGLNPSWVFTQLYRSQPLNAVAALTTEGGDAVVLGGTTETLPFILLCEQTYNAQVNAQSYTPRLAILNIATGETMPLNRLEQPESCFFVKSATAASGQLTLIQATLAAANADGDANLWLYDWSRKRLQSLGRVERLIGYDAHGAREWPVSFSVVVEKADGFWLEHVRLMR